ncbi:ABC transporter permease [Paracoccus salsus]|uniref:ABC transporter permease n=1 Tax=Paracoccus salsus TaxID=2911061 RepID=UPI001F2E824B|nr:ABC transporter permease subunit [Paracoccus salsus]MCF3972771.1 ABC transporter permease subunit [Paracoccus salsus]
MTRSAALAPAALGLMLLFAGWSLLAMALADTRVIAGPIQVAGWLAGNAGLIGRALAVTLTNAAIGFLAGNLAAILLAGIALVWPRLTHAVSGLALVVFCLPLIATGPILRVLLGPGEAPQIVLAALAVYYTTLIPLMTGLRATPAVWLDLVRSYGRGRLAELIHVRARAGLPYLFAGLQIAAPAAFLGAMVGEFTGAERGLGVLTIRFTRSMDVSALWAIALLAAAVSMVAYGAIGALARAVLHDRPPVILAPPGIGTGAGFGRAVHAALLVVLVLAVWWGAMEALDLNRFFAKRPPDVLAAMIRGPDAAATRGALFEAVAETAVFLLPGYLAGLGLGAGMAILLVLLPGLAALILPVAVALRSIPIVTTAPLIVLFLGRGAAGTITLVAVMVFFPTLVACLHGLRQAPGQILDVFQTYASGPLRQMLHVRLPAMLPALFAAARMSVPAAILAVTVVEWLTTGRGLGSLMALSASTSNYNLLWAAVVVVTAISTICYAAVAMLEARILAIYAPEQMRR